MPTAPDVDMPSPVVAPKSFGEQVSDVASDASDAVFDKILPAVPGEGALVGVGVGLGKIAATIPILAKVSPRVLNAANHVFGPKSLAKHNIGGVLNSFGGDKVAALTALERAAQQLANQGAIRGVFATTVNVAGQTVTVTGAVVGGTARVGTAFIPIP